MGIIEKEITLSNDKVAHLEEYCDEAYAIGSDPEDAYVTIEVKVDKVDTSLNSKIFAIELNGPTKDDLEVEYTYETWDDPGVYPSNAGRGSLPSYDYEVPESATLSDSFQNSDFKVSNYICNPALLEYDFDIKNSKEEILRYTEISEADYEQILKECQIIARKLYEKAIENLDEYDLQAMFD